MLAILLIVFVTRASTPPISFVDNTSGQVTANHHQLEATGGDSGNYAEDVSSSSYNLQSGASGYRLSGQLQIGGMTACNDGDTA